LSGERNSAEEALAWLDSAPCGLMQTAADGTFLKANRTFCGWIGLAPSVLIGHRRFQDLLTMGARIFHLTHWAPLLQMQGSISEVKLDVVHQDGSTIPLVVNAIRHEHGGAVVHDLAAYVARDRDKYERELVLSRKRLENLVAEATRLQAEAKDRAVFAEQMIGIVSHDLRNPLSAIVTAGALLARQGPSAPQQRIIERVSRSADRALRLIGDLLDFTQARVGTGLSVSIASVDLHQAVADAVEELSHVYPNRVLHHVRAGEGGCSADIHRLHQLIGNLVSNAMTYGDPAHPVTVTSTIEAGSCSIAVHNRGTPIPAEAHATIFEAMTRGTSTSAVRSVGLGLFIVREIARAHGGTATLDSTAASGTTFRAVFPSAPRPAA
jgi:sigma-B regulation protein RsbU (phosphoserine phosphatase)